MRERHGIERGIELLHIQPGKPTQNGRLESFNARLREECLRVSWFQNLFDARREDHGLAERVLGSIIQHQRILLLGTVSLGRDCMIQVNPPTYADRVGAGKMLGVFLDWLSLSN